MENIINNVQNQGNNERGSSEEQGFVAVVHFKPIPKKCFDQARHLFTKLLVYKQCVEQVESYWFCLRLSHTVELDGCIFSHLCEDICQIVFITHFLIFYFPVCGIFHWEIKLWLGYSNELELPRNVNSRHWGMALLSFSVVLCVTFSYATEYLMTSHRDAQLILLKGVLNS